MLSEELSLFGRTKELILVELLPVLSQVIVTRAYSFALVLFLPTLLGKPVLVGLEVYLVEKGSDALRLKG